MGMLSLFAHGAAEAGSQILNKYIDEEMQMRKAEAMADLQRRTAGAIREDDDKFKNDPTRIARDRENKRQDVLAAGSAARESELAGLNDTAYQGAKTAAADREAASAARREIEKKTQMLSNPELVKAERDKARGDADAKADIEMGLAKRMAADAEYMKAQQAIKLNDPEVKQRIEASKAAAAASYASAANSNAHASQAKMQTEALKRVDDIYAEMLKTIDDKTLTPELRAEKLNGLQAKLSAISPSKGKGGDEDDTEKITTKTIDKDGNERTVESTHKRKPGAGGPAESAPYPDGTELRGKDGNIYVVRGGQPVLKGQAKPGAQKTGAAKPSGMASSEIENAEKIQRMDPDTFRAYQSWKEGQPTSPRDRQLLRAAGFSA